MAKLGTAEATPPAVLLDMPSSPSYRSRQFAALRTRPNDMGVTLMNLRRTLLAGSLAVSLTSLAHAATFQWSFVGDIGNPPDPTVDFTYGTSGYGRVDYGYSIAKHEVTNAQYVEFLNAVARSDPNSLFHPAMNFESQGGIVRSGVSGTYSYSVRPDEIGMGPGEADGEDYTLANKPVVFVTFSNAMRFANWLENGQPVGAQGPTTTEDGAYEISDGLSETRNAGAKFFLPTEDEWHKAAYYDRNGSYFVYPTRSNAAPDNELPSNDTGNSANLTDGNLPTADPLRPFVDVGSYSLTYTAYGTFDQAGNVWEWNESSDPLLGRGVRGGSYNYSPYAAQSAARTWRNGVDPDVGFRLVRIPEPSSFTLVFAAIAGCMRWRRSEYRR